MALSSPFSSTLRARLAFTARAPAGDRVSQSTASTPLKRRVLS
jgi:hypothetical protein